MLQLIKNNGKKHFVELEYSTEIDDDYLYGQVEFAYEKRLLYSYNNKYNELDPELEEMIEKLDQHEIEQPSIYNFMAYIYKKLKPRDKDVFAQAVLDYPQESYKLYKKAKNEAIEHELDKQEPEHHEEPEQPSIPTTKEEPKLVASPNPQQIEMFCDYIPF